MRDFYEKLRGCAAFYEKFRESIIFSEHRINRLINERKYFSVAKTHKACSAVMKKTRNILIKDIVAADTQIILSKKDF